MTPIEALKYSRGPSFTLMATGVYWGALSGMMPEIKAAVGASDGQMGVVLLMPALASVVAMGIAPRVVARVGGIALPIAGLLIAAGLMLYLTVSSAVGLGVILFVGGFAVAFADMTANVRLAHVEAKHDVHLMNFNHATYSYSFAITALLIGFLRFNDWGFQSIAPVLAGLVMIYVIAGWDVKDPGGEVGRDADKASKRPAKAVVLLAALVLFCSFVTENGVEAWSALHIERTLGGVEGSGSFGPAVFGLVMGTARLSGQMLTRRLGVERLILFSTGFAVVGAMVIAAAPTVPVVQIGVALSALGVAVIVPSTNSIIARKVPDAARARAISLAWMVGLLGFFLGPAMIGGISELSSLRWSFVVIGVIAAAIIPAILALSRR